MMKDNFRNRSLLYLVKSAPTHRGFTLIELLVVIIVVGVLSAIAIPSFIQQISRARTAEATSNVAAINRAQSVYHARQLKFAANFNNLDVNVNARYYDYLIDNPTSNYAGVKTVTQWPEVKAVSGAIVTANGQMKSVVCISGAEVNLGDPSVVPDDQPLALLACPATYTELGN
jgi:type IV pilus assembly protein PilA